MITEILFGIAIVSAIYFLTTLRTLEKTVINARKVLDQHTSALK